MHDRSSIVKKNRTKMFATNPPLVYKIRYSERGYPYGVWEPEVPRIPPELLDCSVYLYPTASDARAGLHYGGSGFLLGLITEFAPGRFQWHLYAVTNAHVIRDAEATVIRLNTKNGEFDVLGTDAASWVCHPGGDDLAVCPFAPSEVHRFSFVEADRLISRNQVYGITSVVPGMDVFVVGRHIGRDGQQRNTPTVRMGNVAQLPDEPVELEDGSLREMFLVDMRSMRGYSGSPAVVFTQYMEIKAVPHSVNPSGMRNTWKEDWRLLGVNRGYLIEETEVYRRKGNVNQPTNMFIEGNAGIALIVPAWKLTELLEVDTLKEMRKRADAHAASRPDRVRAVPGSS
jgi:hypothetical protein